MSKTFTDLRDGALYKLERDVINPHGDGRAKYDATKHKVWPKGFRFRAKKQHFDYEVDGVDPEQMVYFELDFIDARYSAYVVVHRSDFEEKPDRRDTYRFNQVMAIMPALVDCEEDWSSFAKRLGLESYGEEVLRKLHETGLVTLEQIEEAKNAYWAEGDE